MTVSRHPQITEELLSAYLDNEVTDAERSVVEAAIAADPAIAWQVESLRQTIHLLQELPTLALPRAFTLDAILADAQLSEPVAANVTADVASVQGSATSKQTRATKQTPNGQQDYWWHWLLHIWQGGNLHLRNAAAVAFTLLIVLFAGNQLVAPRQPGIAQNRTAMPITASEVEFTASYTTAQATAPDEATPDEVAVTNQVIDTATLKAQPTEQPTAVAVAVVEESAPTAFAKAAGVPETTSTQPATVIQRGAVRIPGDDGDALIEDALGSGSQVVQPRAAASMGADSTDVVETRGTVQTQSREQAVAALTTATTTATVEQSPVVTITGIENENSTQAEATVTLAVISTTTVTVTATITPATAAPSVHQSTGVTGSASDGQPVEVLTGRRDESANETAAATRWLVWAQLITALCTVVLGGLWWRSRG